MAYILKIKGLRDQIELNNDIGEKVKDKFINYVEKGIDSGVVLDKWTGKTSSIENIIREAGSRADEKGNAYKDYVKSYYEERKRILELPLNERASRLMFYKMCRRTFKDDVEITPEEKLEVLKRQHQFFKENPRRIFPDMNIFADLLGNKADIRYGVEIISNMVNADKRAVWKEEEQLASFYKDFKENDIKTSNLLPQ